MHLKPTDLLYMGDFKVDTRSSEDDSIYLNLCVTYQNKARMMCLYFLRLDLWVHIQQSPMKHFAYVISV